MALAALTHALPLAHGTNQGPCRAAQRTMQSMPVQPLPAIPPAPAGPSLPAPAIDAIAQALANAHRSGATWRPDGAWPEITAADAYAVQSAVATQLGWFAEGPRAWKVGGTTDISAAPLPEVLASPASSPATPPVTWVLPAGQDEVLIEAELAFRLASAPPAADHALPAALASLGTVCVSVELIGTRLTEGLSAPPNWKLADQGVHAGLLTGETQPAARFTAFTSADWQAQSCHIRVQRADGTTTLHEGRGNHPAILAGLHPLGTLPWLARHAAAQEGATQGGGLRAGDLVTTGAWLVVQVRRGDVVDVGFDGLPGVRLHIA